MIYDNNVDTKETKSIGECQRYVAVSKRRKTINNDWFWECKKRKCVYILITPFHPSLFWAPKAWTANVAPTSGTSITLTNKNYNGVQTAGATLELGILVTFSGPTPAITAATFNGETLTGCGATSAPSTPAPTPAPTPASTPESTVNPGTGN